MPSVFAAGPLRVLGSPGGPFGAFGIVRRCLLLVEFTGRPYSPHLLRRPLCPSGPRSWCSVPWSRPTRWLPIVTMGDRRVPVLFAGIVAPAERHGDDGGLAHLRPPGGRGAAGLGHRAAAARVDNCRRLLHRGCMLVWPPPWHDNLRRRLAAAVSAVARLADAPRRRASTTRRRTRTSPTSCRSSASNSRARPIRRRARRQARSRCPSWWAVSSGSPATAP